MFMLGCSSTCFFIHAWGHFFIFMLCNLTLTYFSKTKMLVTKINVIINHQIHLHERHRSSQPSNQILVKTLLSNQSSQPLILMVLPHLTLLKGPNDQRGGEQPIKNLYNNTQQTSQTIMRRSKCCASLLKMQVTYHNSSLYSFYPHNSYVVTLSQCALKG